MADQDPLPRALVRTIALCVLGGVVVGALLSAHRRATPAQLATLTVISVLYSSAIGLPAMLVFRRVHPWLSGQPGARRWLLYLAILLAITAAGALVVGVVLVAVGWSTFAALWPTYVQGVEIASAVAVPVTLGATAFFTLRARLARHAAAGFFRIHRATLVRLSAIVELVSTADGTRVRLGDGKTELPVARERARALKDKLGL